MIDGLCQGYHWTFDEAFKMTMPQIIMLNHAAYVNGERMRAKWDKPEDDEPVSQVVMNGKTVEELNEDELGVYFRTFNSW